jgi:hypothetical protein
MRREGFALLVAVAVTICPCRAGAHPLDTLAPGQWYQVPNSHIDPLFPEPRPAGNSGPAAVVGAWGGGAFDDARERLLVWGGGHSDYGGNEIYAFDVATLHWSRAWGPLPVVTSIPPECSSTYAGGTPSARHTYDGIQFIPTTGKLWATGGFRFCGNPSADTVTWLFDFAGGTWSQGAKTLEAVGTPTSAWDPNGQRVLYQAQNLFQAYDPITDHYTKLGEVDGGFWSSTVSVVDVTHNLLLAVGNGKLRVWNLSTNQFASDQPNTGGGRATAGQPGVAWDPKLGRIVTWSGGTSVWSLDVASWTWFEHMADPANPAAPAAPVPAGTFGRFRYMPGRNAYVLVNKTSDDVYFYKLTAGLGTPVAAPADAGIVVGVDASGDAAGAAGNRGGSGGTGAAGVTGGVTGATGSTPSSVAGCGCAVSARPSGASWWVLLLAIGRRSWRRRSMGGPQRPSTP